MSETTTISDRHGRMTGEAPKQQQPSIEDLPLEDLAPLELMARGYQENDREREEASNAGD